MKCNDSYVGVRSTLLAGVGGALAGATALAFVRPARVPPDLRREMIQAAESFALAALEASDLVEEALVAHEKGQPRPNEFDPAEQAIAALDPGTKELVDRAEQAIDALEPKMIRIGLVFGQDSRPHWRAIDSSLRLRVVFGILRGENGSEILRRKYGPWWALDAPRAAYEESGAAQVAFREAAATEIRGAYLPLRQRDKAGVVDFRRRLEKERDASPELRRAFAQGARGGPILLRRLMS
jgi:hypothetical protein